jgi:septal ring factor EnvC (AmiA/AmiB activator)
MADEDAEGLRGRLARQGEDALGKLAQDLLENPLVNGAITRAFSAREHAVHAQEAALGALNIPSAADIERLTKRLRSVSQRLEGVEDRLDGVQAGVDRLSAQLEAAARGSDPGVAGRLTGVEAQLVKLTLELGHVANALDAGPAPVHRSQERLAVDGPPAAKPAAKKPAARKTAAKKKK